MHARRSQNPSKRSMEEVDLRKLTRFRVQSLFREISRTGQAERNSEAYKTAESLLEGNPVAFEAAAKRLDMLFWFAYAQGQGRSAVISFSAYTVSYSSTRSSTSFSADRKHNCKTALTMDKALFPNHRSNKYFSEMRVRFQNRKTPINPATAQPTTNADKFQTLPILRRLCMQLRDETHMRPFRVCVVCDQTRELLLQRVESVVALHA